jgi:hypothetical protein
MAASLPELDNAADREVYLPMAKEKPSSLFRRRIASLSFENAGSSACADDDSERARAAHADYQFSDVMPGLVPGIHV